METLIVGMLAVAHTAVVAGIWLLGAAGDGPVDPAAAFPYAIQLGVGGVFLWFCLRLQSDLKAERASAATQLAAERQAHRDAFTQERAAHNQALRAERDAHQAEITRERGESQRLYDRLIDKVIPTLEATIHAVNEQRAMAERERERERDRERYDQGHGRSRGE